MKWPMVKLGDFTEKVDYGLTASAKDDVNGPRFLRITDMQDDCVDWSTVPSCDCTEKELKGNFLSSGDIVFARTGATTGKSYLIRELSFPAVFASYLIRVRPSSDLDSKYLSYFFKSPIYWYQISIMANGAAQPGVNSTKLKELLVPLPPMEEQKRIAAILDKADAIRRKRQQAIELADDFLRSVFLDMFGDPVTNPKGWEVKPLDEYLKFLTSGSRGWAKYYSETGSKFIRIQNVSKNKLLLDDMAFVNAPDGAESTRTKVQLDDVLLSITADLGRSSVVIDEIAGGHINQHLALLRLDKEKLNPRYLSAYLSSDAGVRQFKMKNKSAVKAGLNFTDIKTLEILTPPIEKQDEYQRLYEKVRANESKQFDSGSFVNSIFEALIQKAFSVEL